MKQFQRLSVYACTVLCSFVVVSTAYAQRDTTWDFRNNMPKQAGIQTITNADITGQGIHIQTNTDGMIFWNDYPLNTAADVVTFRIQSQRETEAAWMWQPSSLPDGQLLRMYFVIPAGENATDISVPMNYYSEWERNPKTVAISFPAGSNLYLESITFTSYSIGEKIIEGWKSFWTFDKSSPRSINFLWGPLITTNPIARTQLFESLPPMAWSAMRIVYVVLCLIIAIVILQYIRGKIRKPIHIIIGALFVCWIALEIRMSAELMSYAYEDLTNYVLAEDDQKSFKGLASLHVDIDSAMKTIKEYDQFSILVPPSTSIPAYMRYLAYPSVPVFDANKEDAVPVWFVYARPDIRINSNGELVQNGTVLTEAGEVVEQYNEKSFLFVTTP